MMHFFGHQFLVYLACESVAPLGVHTAHILSIPKHKATMGSWDAAAKDLCLMHVKTDQTNPEHKNVWCTFACSVPAPLH